MGEVVPFTKITVFDKSSDMLTWKYCGLKMGNLSIGGNASHPSLQQSKSFCILGLGSILLALGM
jgi:hypothetical protein